MEKNHSIPETCSIAGISKAMLYKLWKMNQGPKKIKIGSRSFVTSQSLSEWLRSLESQNIERQNNEKI